MIVLVSGLTGSGKTNTAYALMLRDPSCRFVFYETDLFTARIPMDWRKKTDIEAIYQRAGILIDHDVSRGDQSFILTLSMPMLRHFQDFKEYLQSASPMFLVCLRCELDEVRRRIKARGRNPQQLKLELDSVDRDYRYLDQFLVANPVTLQIDNTRITERQVAEKIYAKTKGTQNQAL